MAKRFYSSNNGSSINHKNDHHNDEDSHDKDSRNGSMGFRNQNQANEGYYADVNSRRTQEMQDAGMIRENPNAIANLPQEVMIKPYPKNGPYIPEGLDDTIRGVDMQMDYDDEQRRAHFYPKKV